MSAPSSSSVHEATGANLPTIEQRRSATPPERRAAALTVARYSTDVDDCQHLLDMLGLLDIPAAS